MHNKLTVINIYHNIHHLGSPATLTSSHATINQGKYSAGAASCCHCISGNSHPRGGKWHRRQQDLWQTPHFKLLHTFSSTYKVSVSGFQGKHSGFKMSSGCRYTGGVASNVSGHRKAFGFILMEAFQCLGEATLKGVRDEPKLMKKTTFKRTHTTPLCLSLLP